MHTESEPRHNLYTSIQVKQIQHVCFHACERMFNLLINEEHNVQSVIFWTVSNTFRLGALPWNTIYSILHTSTRGLFVQPRHKGEILVTRHPGFKPTWEVLCRSRACRACGNSLATLWWHFTTSAQEEFGRSVELLWTRDGAKQEVLYSQRSKGTWGCKGVSQHISWTSVTWWVSIQWLSKNVPSKRGKQTTSWI